MKTSVIFTGAAVAAALAGATAFAQQSTPQGNPADTGLITGQAVVDRAQAEGATGLMGPGVTGPKSRSAQDPYMGSSSSAGQYGADTSAQTTRTTSGTGAAMGTAAASTTTDRSGSMESNRAVAQNDSGAMMRAGERG